MGNSEETTRGVIIMSGSVFEYLTPVERKGREGRRGIMSFFASLAASAFDRDVPEALQTP
jgi:hypothetical protein